MNDLHLELGLASAPVPIIFAAMFADARRVATGSVSGATRSFRDAAAPAAIIAAAHRAAGCGVTRETSSAGIISPLSLPATTCNIQPRFTPLRPFPGSSGNPLQEEPCDG